MRGIYSHLRSGIPFHSTLNSKALNNMEEDGTISDDKVSVSEWVEISSDELRDIVKETFSSSPRKITRIKCEGRGQMYMFKDLNLPIWARTWTDYSFIVESDDFIPEDMLEDEYYCVSIFKEVVTVSTQE